MSQYMIQLDKKRCIACHACEVHCQTKNGLPAAVNLGKLVAVGPELAKGKPRLLTLYMPCFHCERPWCVPACPTGAMTRRESDGVVSVKEELCVGCKACIQACPWNIPQFNPVTGKAVKCDYCRDRIDEGLDPACVTGCTAQALRFNRPGKKEKDEREVYATRILLRQG